MLLPGIKEVLKGNNGPQDSRVPVSYTHLINMEDYEPITVEIYADEAPITATNFLKLAGEGFYDGLTFHRIISGFMIQGGDPLGNGMGGSEETIKGEFASNGVENPLSHTRGAISMARSQFPDSASSQFFIVHEDSTYLDGDYAVFGYVTAVSYTHLDVYKRQRKSRIFGRRSCAGISSTCIQIPSGYSHYVQRLLPAWIDRCHSGKI